MGSKSYSKGISWIDDCRIPHNEDLSILRDEKKLDTQNQGWGFKSVSRDNSGRFPANILVSDDMLNDGKKYGNLFNTNRNKDVDGGTGNSLVRAHKQGESNGICDNGISSSRFYDIDKWFDNLIE